MKIKSIYPLIFLLLSLIHCNSTEPEPEVGTFLYRVTEISGEPIEIRPSENPSWDVPLEIKLVDYKMGSDDFKGYVKFIKLGWLEIKEPNPNNKMEDFCVDTKGKLEQTEKISFSEIKVNSYNITGNFLHMGICIEIRSGLEFVAKRKIERNH